MEGGDKEENGRRGIMLVLVEMVRGGLIGICGIEGCVRNGG